MFTLLPVVLDSSVLATRLLVNPNPNPNLSYTHNPFFSRSLRTHPSVLRCAAAPLLASSFSGSSSCIAGAAEYSTESLYLRIRRISNEFRSLPEPIDRVKRLLFYAADLPPLSEADRIPSNRVTGCTAQVWLSARIDVFGRMRFAADSDSEITRGFCACLLAAVDGAFPEDVLAIRTDDLADINVIGVSGYTQSRVNTWHNVLISMQKRARTLMADEESGHL
ncbi:hypothetical protein KSP40_PGU022291 [Platanthera guangdongensis]|uniref:Fe-S metabolism associated domain-containing protein n=1 Tax=Platanthera guangdongensis TaxID=2320717 RepID=A0ABR2M3V2_9ASPA